MSKPIRRVVTGHNAEGKSVFIFDGPAPSTHTRGPGSAFTTELWETRESPADNRGNEDVTEHPYRLPPPKGGSVFRVIAYPPDKERLAALERERDAHDDGSGRAAALDHGNPRHPGFHKTNSIDYAIVLSGEIYAMMDEGEVLLRPGDILVQRGTNHAWSNRGEEPAYVAFVLMDAQPI
jgi:mannose-6-phosphate isomerase-like protein (cupin superfamily)